MGNEPLAEIVQVARPFAGRMFRPGIEVGQGDGIYGSTPCYAWNNTFNGQPPRMEVSRRTDLSENERAQIQEGRDFFNEEPKPEYYKLYTYPHPLQGKP
jgi:hypothetical protein